MTELSRPTSIREMLNQLSRPTLIRLCQIRAQAVSRSNDDCRSSVARSFRGKRDEFLAALSRDELLSLLRLPVRDGAAVLLLPKAYSYAKADLLELAKLAFGPERELGLPFIAQRFGAERIEEEEEFSATALIEAADADPEPAKPLPNVIDARQAKGWTRPRPVRAILAQLGLVEPNSFGQVQFSAMMEALECRGFEVATAEGTLLTPLHDAVSIDAELRLRHDALAAPSSSGRGILSGIVNTSESPRELGDYERAVLRLELLTATTNEHALFSPERLEQCLASATAGLSLHDSARRLLERVAKTYARTLRDPILTLIGIAARLDVEDGEVLLREYAILHSCDDARYSLLREHWAALCDRSTLSTPPSAESDCDRLTNN